MPAQAKAVGGTNSNNMYDVLANLADTDGDIDQQYRQAPLEPLRPLLTNPAYTSVLAPYLLAEDLTLAIRPPVQETHIQTIANSRRQYPGVARLRSCSRFQSLSTPRIDFYLRSRQAAVDRLETDTAAIHQVATNIHFSAREEEISSCGPPSDISQLQSVSRPLMSELYSAAQNAPLVHLTNFGQFELRDVPEFCLRSSRTVFVTPTWHMECLTNLEDLLSGFHVLRAVVFGAKIMASVSKHGLHPANMLSGLFVGATEPLCRLRAMAEDVAVLPANLHRSLDHPNAFIARQLTVTSHKSGTVSALHCVVLRQVSSSDKTEIASARTQYLRSWSDIEPYTPWEVTKLCEKYLSRRLQGKSELEAMELIPHNQLTYDQHRDQWETHLGKLEVAKARQPWLLTKWDDDLRSDGIDEYYTVY